MPLNTLSPQKSYHRLRTAFLSSASSSQQSPLSPTSPTTPTSLTPSSSFSTLSSSSSSSSRFFPSRLFNISYFPNFSRSTVNTHHSSGRLIRRRKSTLEMEQEEELLVMGDGLVGLIEPRPWGGLTLAVGGIEEVLEGRA